jgi:hypothetical protein
MRHIGHPTPELQTLTGADALRQAAVHQATGSALAAVNTVGMAKGIYRFKTHEEANAHAEEALARAIAINVAARKLTSQNSV